MQAGEVGSFGVANALADDHRHLALVVQPLRLRRVGHVLAGVCCQRGELPESADTSLARTLLDLLHGYAGVLGMHHVEEVVGVVCARHAELRASACERRVQPGLVYGEDQLFAAYALVVASAVR